MRDEAFDRERQVDVGRLGTDPELAALTPQWLSRAQTLRYSYQFDWLGVPIIQYPQDIVAMQEIVWSVRPDLIVETGVARGGSAIFYASMLELLAVCGGAPDAEVLAVDIDIRPGNRQAIEAHPLSRRISLMQGSSTAAEIIDEVHRRAAGKERVLVCLDSNHTHAHVLDELRAYAPLVSTGSYVVVFDTLVEGLPPDAIGDRPWGKGNSPWTAVQQFLKEDASFGIDESIPHKLLVTVAKDGFLKRLR